jgi:hypothetical protein
MELDEKKLLQKYHGQAGLSWWDPATCRFVLDEQGQPIPVATKMTRCPHCGAIRKAK